MNHIFQFVVAVALAVTLVFQADALMNERARKNPTTINTSIKPQAKAEQTGTPLRAATKMPRFSTSARVKPAASSAKAPKSTKPQKKVVAKKSTKKVATSKTKTKQLAGKKVTSKVAAKRSAKKRTAIAARKSKRKPVKKIASVRKIFPPSGKYMWRPPEVKLASLPSSVASHAKLSFANGVAGRFSPHQLISSGTFVDMPLYGGIFERREKVKYIVMHSTETGRPADGPRVIKSWNRGMSHPGAQYVVDRDGTIYQTVSPDYATVHVNVKRTLNGVNNDNSIGIEIVRAGKQKYTADQLDSVTRLVAYLQGRYQLSDERVVGHGHIQPSTRTDPVNFDWNAFKASLSMLKLEAMNIMKRTQS